MKSIAEQPAAVTTLRKSVPANVAAAVAKALEKLPADRFASAREFAQALSDVNFRFGASDALAARATGSRSAFATRAVAAVLLLAAGGVAGAWAASRAGTAQGAAPDATVRFTLPGDTTGGLYFWGDRALAVSPDGARIVAVGSRAGGGSALFVREMADVEWRELAGTDGALNPEFSPDGEWLAFIRGDAMVKMPFSGGPVARLATVGEDGGKPSWGPKGRIVLSIGSRLATIDENGGVPRFVPDADSAVAQLGWLYPFVLADGTHALFSRNNGAVREIGVVELETGAVDLLGINGQVFGVVDGVLIFGQPYGGDVSGVRFDERTRKVVGDAVALTTTGLLRAGATRDGNLGAVSRNGVFAYAAGAVRSDLVERVPGRPPRVLWRDVRVGQARYSPDGTRVVTSAMRDVWMIDLAPGAAPRRVTADSASDRPEWTADGERSARSSRYRISVARRRSKWAHPTSSTSSSAAPYQIEARSAAEGIQKRSGVCCNASQRAGELGIAPPTLPPPRAPTSVHAGKDLDGLRSNDEVDGIREVRKDASSDIAMHDAELLRRLDNRF